MAMVAPQSLTQQPGAAKAPRYSKGRQGTDQTHLDVRAEEAGPSRKEIGADGWQLLSTLSPRILDWNTDSDSEDEPAAPSFVHDDDFPTEMTIYPDTDTEGEPQVKTAAELWPLIAVDRRRPRLPTLTRCSRRASKESVASESTDVPCSRRSSKESACSWTPTSFLDGSVSLGCHEFDDSAVTTLVVRNLPLGASQNEFLGEVDRSGFAGAYDFAYVPCSFDGGHSNGTAFVNFRTPELAATFRVAWHFSTRLGMSPGSAALNVAAASLQGFHANASRWTAERVSRTRGVESLPFICQETLHEVQAERCVERGHRSPGATRADGKLEATTLVVRNLSERVTQQEFLDEVNRSGFAGKYDFAYLPCSRNSGRGSGHAFVNFRTGEVASTFKARWHRGARLNMNSSGTALSVAPSAVQGFRDNTVKWTCARQAQVKNPRFLPFIYRPSQSGDGAEAA